MQPPQYRRAYGVTSNLIREILAVPKTKEKIIDIIFQADVVADAATLRDDINLADQGIDSMDMFTIMLAVQDYYEIQIPDKDVEGLLTIDDLANYIKSKQK